MKHNTTQVDTEQHWFLLDFEALLLNVEINAKDKRDSHDVARCVVGIQAISGSVNWKLAERVKHLLQWLSQHCSTKQNHGCNTG